MRTAVPKTPGAQDSMALKFTAPMATCSINSAGQRQQA
jgi:hypothetical protein